MNKFILCKVKSTDSNMHANVACLPNGLACLWLENDICMQNVIKIYYVVKSYEYYQELLTDGRADKGRAIPLFLNYL